MVIIINKLCPVITTTLVFALHLNIVITFAIKLDTISSGINEYSKTEVDSFLHNNDQLPVVFVNNRKEKREAITGFKYDGDAVNIDGESEVNVNSNRQGKAAIVNKGSSLGLNDSTGLTRIRRSKQDLCQHLCTCDTEGTEKFLTVSCSFLMDKEYLLGSNFFIQNTTRRLRITLSDRTVLRIDDGFFQNNFVARLSEDRIRELKVNVTNCNEVFITKDTFSKTRFGLNLDEIENLVLFEGAFAGSVDGKVIISNAHMNELNAIGTSLKMFQVKNSSIGKIASQAFSVVSIDLLVFENSKIDKIEKGSVAEKLFCKYLAFIGCTIDVIESNAIDGSGIMDFELIENKINTIQKQAFVGTSLSTSIQANTIKSVGYHWLSMRDWTNITIHNNTFGEWSAINIGKTTNPDTCVFSRNFITKLASDSLNFNHSSCKLRDISFFNLCSCNVEWLEKLSPVKLIGESFCRVDETLKHCFNSTTFSIQRYLEQVCDSKTKQLDCMKNMNVKKIEGKFISPDEIRKTSKEIMIICVLGIACLLALIITLVVFFACRKSCGKSDDSENYLLTGRVKRSKTFSDDDRRIIINTLDTMKLTETHALYNRVYQNTKKLMDGGLDEADKVLCIGEIVRALHERQNPSTDYVAFTDILYKQLRPIESAPPESEVEDMTTINDTNIEIERQTSHNNEHIYAEPQLCGAQKPLLNNDYALPMDKDLQEALPLYSEPIRKVKTPPEPLPRMATPYAIGNATNVVQLTPSDAISIESPTTTTFLPSSTKNANSSKQNLPDILYQSVNNNNNNKSKFNNNRHENESTEIHPQHV
uniref:CSON001504 protein n=1 Tax=Culicoides sonorensis TaxID=179676 RepID=A0A336K525_CULSO